MNLMYYRMVNGYGYYPSCSALTPGSPSPGAGLLGSGATAAASGALPLGGATAAAAAASALAPKWVMPNFSSTQIQYMFRNRMDKGLKVNKAVKCDLCAITLNSEMQAQQHYSGKSHLKKLRQGKKKDGESDKDSSERRKSKERGKHRDKNRKDNDGDDDDDNSKDDGSSSQKDDSVDSKSDKDDGDLEDDENDNDDDLKETAKSENSALDRIQDNRSSTLSPENVDIKVINNDLEASETDASSCCDLEKSEVTQNTDKSQNKSHNDHPDTNSSLEKYVEEIENLSSERINNFLKDDPGFQSGTEEAPSAPVRTSPNPLADGLDTAPLSLTRTPSSEAMSLCISSSSTSGTICAETKSTCDARPFSNRKSSLVPLSSCCPYRENSKLTSDSSPSPSSSRSSPADAHKVPSHVAKSSPVGVSRSGSSTPKSYPSVSVRSPISKSSAPRYSHSDSSRSLRPLKRTYDNVLRSSYLPASLSSSHHSATSLSSSSLAPYKKPHSAYLGGTLSGIDLRAPTLCSPHLALPQNSIPGYNPLSGSMRHISDPTMPSANMIRPMVHATTSLPSPLASYTTPQYGSGLQSSLNPSSVNPASYPLQYPSDLTSLQRGLLNPYYTGIPSAAAPQQPPMLQAAEPLTLDHSLLNSDLISAPMMGQQLTLKYASTVPTTASLPYQYGTSIQAISIQAIGSDPGTNGLFQGSSCAPYSSPSSQYLSLTDGSPGSLSSAPQVQAAVPGWTPAVSAQMGATFTQSGHGQGHNQGQQLQAQSHIPTINATKPQSQAAVSQGPAGGKSGKLDPVAQAVYDNVLGNLPTKRKREIPCQVCDMVFNSDAQANAHFIGSKHVKRQKLIEGPEGDVMANSTGQSTFNCTVCKVTLNSQQQRIQHETGEKHKNRMLGLSNPKNPYAPVKNSSTWSEVTGHRGGWFYCDVCDISVPTAMALKEHTKSETHKAAVELSNENGQ